jgi:hypothetical protein
MDMMHRAPRSSLETSLGPKAFLTFALRHALGLPTRLIYHPLVRRMCGTLPAVLFLAPLTLFTLSAPSHGAVTVTGDSVTFAWNPSAGAEGYYVLYAPYGAEPFKGAFEGRIDVGNRTRVSFELWEGAAFHVAVQAYNRAGESSASNVVSFVRPLKTPAPTLDIKVNGSDETKVVSSAARVSVTIAIDDPSGDLWGRDVWVAAETPEGFSSYGGAEGWVGGLVRYDEVPSGNPVLKEVMNTRLAPGNYQFYLAVDDNGDHHPDGTWWDSVGLKVVDRQTWWELFWPTGEKERQGGGVRRRA